MEHASRIDEIQEAVRSLPRLRVRGGGTKPALCRGAELSLDRLSGVLEYEPSEFTFTALAGTSIASLEKLLAAHGQYLPFDPPLGQAGATLGGTLAAGLSGPGRFRYGGVRDFVLGIRFVNGEGDVVRGGGKVVKNAAGFDLPKLMVGSLGEFGVLVEVTCKVFPCPAAWATLAVSLPDLAQTVETMCRLAASPLDLFCLDLEPPGRLWLRIGGLAEALSGHVDRVVRFLPPASQASRLTEPEEPEAWRCARELAWAPPDHGLVKVPLAPLQIPELEHHLAKLSKPVPRRYSVGGNMAWLAWPGELKQEALVAILQHLRRPGLALRSVWSDPRLGDWPGGELVKRLRPAFDPFEKFSIPTEKSPPGS